jgi:ATP-binding cassette subfamily B protein
MIERVDGDVTALANFFSQFVLLVLANALFLAGVLLLLFREDWRVGLGMGLFTATSLVVLSRLQRRAVPHWKALSQASAALSGFLEERLAGVEDIRSRGAVPHAVRLFHRHTRERFLQGRRALLPATLVVNAALLLWVVGNVVALGLGAHLHAAGAATLGTVYMFFYYSNLIGVPVRQLTDQIGNLQRATAAVQRIAELAQTRSAIEDTGAARGGEGVRAASLAAGPLAVELDRVSFAYGDEDGEAVLHDVSLRLEAGKVLGLLGRTGSGKTTLGRLLLRLYDPTSGAVRVGGVDLREVPLAEVRRRIAMVTQDVQLFRASVRDNVTLFDRTVPDDHILAALRDLDLRDWFESLPAGLDTELAPGGLSGEAVGGLSAGEAQLLAFARVFLRDPGLVVLDEASSRLDPETERRVERAVGRLLAGRTAVVIAHRLATLQQADEILILEGGRIAEHGARERLADDPRSRFSQLLRAGMEEVLA